MMMKTLIAALIAGSAFSVAAPAGTVVYVQIGPPPAQIEVVPAPRRGYMWTPGYWDWRGQQHVWVSGRWMRERPGYYYREPRWVEHDGRWAMERGHWRRGDRDGDGVPNRADRAPDNPRVN